MWYPLDMGGTAWKDSNLVKRHQTSRGAKLVPQNFIITMATSCLLCLHFMTCLMYNWRQRISKSVLQVPLLVPPEQAVKRIAGCVCVYIYIYGESRQEQQHVPCSARTACIFVCQCLGSRHIWSVILEQIYLFSQSFSILFLKSDFLLL